MMGLRPGDRLFFPFSFGPFLGFWGAFGAASACGYLTLPGGGMSSAARLRFMLHHAATVVFCTPSYALHLAEVAGVEGIDLAASPVRMIVAAGEPGAGIPATRQADRSRLGRSAVRSLRTDRGRPDGRRVRRKPRRHARHGPRLHRRGDRPGDGPIRSRRARSASWS